MILQVKDLQSFYDCSAPTAIKRKQEILKYFKSKTGRVHLEQVSKYEGLTDQQVLKRIIKKYEFQ